MAIRGTNRKRTVQRARKRLEAPIAEEENNSLRAYMLIANVLSNSKTKCLGIWNS
ncbi:hypothetical protein EV12_1346 [Prochlorococcus sp. MIT 0701]|nr:hypothetical protein EV12_1346 [Prochlorococcus sp. MIT 0701]